MIEAAVVDASVGVKWVVNETGSDLARSLSQTSLHAPDLFPIECGNILWKKVRLRDLTRRNAMECLDTLLQAPVAIVPTQELMPQALDLAFDLQHPVSDCVYLALALLRGIPLVTADERLAKAARKSRKTTDKVILLPEIRAAR
ncbi:MAG: type II toxin-antitoxin system VapC family toxin [Bryobacteraceae bacterium]